MEQISGWSLQEMQGLNWFKTFLPEHRREEIHKVFLRAISGKQTDGQINAIKTKSGELREIEWKDAPLTSRTGKTIGLLCTGQDVTENRRLEREVLEISAEEQRRIGQDLHDVVGQELTALAMLADSLVLALKRSKAEEVSIATIINAGLSETLGKVRMLSRGLNPVDIDAEGLMQALELITKRLREFHGVNSSFDCPEPVLFKDNRIANQLYRIAEEATNNAMKHSRAEMINIRLTAHNHLVELTVSDNGIGFKREGQETDCLGLHIMNYRANLINGSLTIESSPEQGTEIYCQVRLDRSL